MAASVAPRPVPAGFCAPRVVVADAVQEAQYLDNLIAADRNEIVQQQQLQLQRLSFAGAAAAERTRRAFVAAAAAAAVPVTEPATSAGAAAAVPAVPADVPVTAAAPRGPPGPPPRRHPPKKKRARGPGYSSSQRVDVNAFAEEAPARRAAVRISMDLPVDWLREALSRYDAIGSDVETEDEFTGDDDDHRLVTMAQIAVTKARRPARRGRPATPPKQLPVNDEQAARNEDDDEHYERDTISDDDQDERNTEEQPAAAAVAEEQVEDPAAPSSHDECVPEKSNADDWKPLVNPGMVELDPSYATIRPLVPFGEGEAPVRVGPAAGQRGDLVSAISSQRSGFKEALRNMCLSNADWALHRNARRLPSGLLVRVTDIMVMSGGYYSIGRGLQFLPPSPGLFAWPYKVSPRELFGGDWFEVETVMYPDSDHDVGHLAFVEELNQMEGPHDMTLWHSWVLYNSEHGPGTEELRRILSAGAMRNLERVDHPLAEPRPLDKAYFKLLDNMVIVRPGGRRELPGDSVEEEAIAVYDGDDASCVELHDADEVPGFGGIVSEDAPPPRVSEGKMIDESDDDDTRGPVDDDDAPPRVSEGKMVDESDDEDTPVPPAADVIDVDAPPCVPEDNDDTPAPPPVTAVDDDDPDLYYDSDAHVMWYGTKDPGTGVFKKILGLSDVASALDAQADSRPRNLRGQACSVYWDGNNQWFVGKIVRVRRDRSKVLVKYADDSEEWEPLDKNLRLLDEVTPFCVAADCSTACGPDARIEDSQFQDPMDVALCYYELVSFCHEVQSVSQTAAVVVCCRQGLIRSAAIWIRMVSETTRKPAAGLLNYLRKHYDSRTLSPKNMAAEVVYLPFAMGKCDY